MITETTKNNDCNKNLMWIYVRDLENQTNFANVNFREFAKLILQNSQTLFHAKIDLPCVKNSTLGKQSETHPLILEANSDDDAL